MSKDFDLEKRHFGEGGANVKYPCMRNEYTWGEHRPDVPDSRLPAKENTVIHGLEEDAKKFVADAKKYSTAFHYQMAADYYNMAGNRRAELIKTIPELTDRSHLDAIDFCYDRAREYEAQAELLGSSDAGEWKHEYIFETHTK